MWTKDTANSEVVVKEEAADTTELTSSHNIILEPQHRYTTASTIILEPNIIPRQEKRVSRVIFEPLAPSASLSPSSHDTDRSSPRILEALHPPGYTDLSYGVTVTLTPNTTGDYLDTSGSLQVGSTQLQYITPLPSFHSLPSSPNSKMNYSPPTAIVDGIEYSPDDKVEYIGQAVSLADYITYSSPDSSSQALPTSTSTPYNSSRGGHKRRRRRDTGSSTGSGTSTTSRQTKRRRTPISQEELMLQRNLANVRERQRTKNLNDAFSTLREIVPTLPSDKLSKIQTLRLASKYIGFLKQVLDFGGEQSYSGRSQGSIRDELCHSFNMWRMDVGHSPAN